MFTFSSLMALDPQYVITQYQLDTWQRERGLDQRSVVSIRQTSDGYLWLGTFEGLVRFDGIQFKTFNKDNTPQLADNFVWTLMEDKEKNLWIGTVGGLSCLKDGRFKSYPPSKYPGLEGILTIIQARAGGLWIGTEKNGLIHLKDDKSIRYTTRHGLPSNTIRALSHDREGNLWVGTIGGLSFASAVTPGTFSHFNGKNNILRKKHIYSLLHSKKGVLWVGCGDGLFRLQDGNIKGYAQQLPNPQIMSLCEDRLFNIWVGTDGSGLIRVRGDRIETLPDNHRLASDYIYAIFEDEEENLWLGSEGEGLHRMKDTLFTRYTPVEGLNHKDVRCIYKDERDVLLFGTANGVNRFDNGRLTSTWSKKDGLPSNNVTAILKDNKGVFWIGTDKGLCRYKNGKFVSADQYENLNNNWILGLKKDKKGVIWILTVNNIYKYSNGKFLDYRYIKEECRRLYIDSRDNVWIASYGGGIYSIKDGEFSHRTTADNLVHNQVEFFYEDREGILYIGTRGGLSMLRNGTFFNLTTKNGLLDRFVRRITEDDADFLWFTGRTGYSRISKKEIMEVVANKKKKVNPVLFNDSHGLKSPYCYDCIKAEDGKLWFATDKGLAVIHPDNIKDFAPPTRMLLEELIADGEPYYIGKRDYSVKKPLKIPAGTRQFEFNYSGFCFVNPLKSKFQYKLEGFDQHWVDRGTIRNVGFNDLSPGPYTFYVKAVNNGAAHSDEKSIARVSFYLKPYFYETLWFLMPAGISILFAAFSLYRFRVRHLKNRQKILTRLVEQRTYEIDEKNHQLQAQTAQLQEQSEKLKELDRAKSRFFANISHEFRTPLTLLIGPLEQLMEQCTTNETDRKRRLLLMLRNAQRLLGLINQLMDLSKMDSGKMKLQLSKTDMITFLKGITDSFRIMAQQRELDLEFRTDDVGEEICLYVDHRKLEDVMSNLLINAFKFTPAGGKIHLLVRENPNATEKFPNGAIEIIVSDTGPGIGEEELDSVFDRFYQADATYEHHEKGSGIGLALSKELVELHRGTIAACNGKEGGSQFTLNLPRPSPEQLNDAHDTNRTDSLDIGSYAILMADEHPVLPDPVLALQEDTAEDKEDKNIILVVEDSTDMREYIRAALEPLYTVEEGKDGNEGVEMARLLIPDLIVSDIMMPGIDGNELCRTLKSDLETCHVPIILLTAKVLEENIIEGLETGADDYITKPFSTKILCARIKNLIDLRSQLQQNFKREMNLRPVKTSVSTLDRAFLKELQDLLRKNLSDSDFNVEEMCKQLYMSNTTLYRKVQALCGLTPTEFLRSFRLKRAVQLLKSDFGSVTEVAFEVGFSSRAYFTKCFKEKFNQLPSEVHGER